jgi:hypothetical protein
MKWIRTAITATLVASLGLPIYGASREQVSEIVKREMKRRADLVMLYFKANKEGVRDGHATSEELRNYVMNHPEVREALPSSFRIVSINEKNILNDYLVPFKVIKFGEEYKGNGFVVVDKKTGEPIPFRGNYYAVYLSILKAKQAQKAFYKSSRIRTDIVGSVDIRRLDRPKRDEQVDMSDIEGVIVSTRPVYVKPTEPVRPAKPAKPARAGPKTKYDRLVDKINERGSLSFEEGQNKFTATYNDEFVKFHILNLKTKNSTFICVYSDQERELCFPKRDCNQKALEKLCNRATDNFLVQ